MLQAWSGRPTVLYYSSPTRPWPPCRWQPRTASPWVRARGRRPLPAGGGRPPGRALPHRSVGRCTGPPCPPRPPLPLTLCSVLGGVPPPHASEADGCFKAGSREPQWYNGLKDVRSFTVGVSFCCVSSNTLPTCQIVIE